MNSSLHQIGQQLSECGKLLKNNNNNILGKQYLKKTIPQQFSMDKKDKQKSQIKQTLITQSMANTVRN